ncbi:MULTISPECIES: YciI family protein [Kitasatospora]|uniref:YciI family protein n=1 Tax=Kitasatospora TaxID=2063 RepID=UPI000C70A3BD|nr:YciI family protein [Kitasatospora sp. GP30]MDH6145114.1 uncharacterized protein YciI [Kitasatospora sp. GP30]
MFIVTLTYTVPLDIIDELLPEHVSWLEQQYAAGTLLASGRRVPRTGGVLLVRAADRAALDEVLATDPFHRAQAAEYQVVEFTPTMTGPGLEALREPVV